MFVNPDVIKTTSFLISQGERIGTVFFVEIGLNPANNLFGSAFYAVTAKHCVLDPVAIRFPLVSGCAEDIDTPSTDWEKHSETDVAVLPLQFPLNRYDIKPLALHLFASDRDHLARFPSAELADGTIATLQYGTGDEVFTPGLFRQDVGPAIPQPMIRFGHIALKPAVGEKVWIEIEPKQYMQVEAFLVELSTWRGQSGSPIFMNPWEPEFRRPDAVEIAPYSFLVGMAQGFYPAEQQVEIDSNPALVSGLNSGIGVVIPAEYIREVLMSERLKKDREAMLSARSKPKPVQGPVAA